MFNYYISLFHNSSFLKILDILIKYINLLYYLNLKYTLDDSINIIYFNFSLHDIFLFNNMVLKSTFNRFRSFEKSVKPESAFAPITTKPPRNFLACRDCFNSILSL